jgi:hypothetical protein
MAKGLRDRIADRALGRLARAVGDDAARWVQSVGLERAASLVARALGERRGEEGDFEPWQRATLGALQLTMCRYDDVDAPLPEADAIGALEAALDFASHMPPDKRAQLADLLVLFEAGPYALGPRRARFTRLSDAEMDAYARSWQDARVPVVRGAFGALKSVCMMGYWSRPATWGAIDYALFDGAHPPLGEEE